MQLSDTCRHSWNLLHGDMSTSGALLDSTAVNIGLKTLQRAGKWDTCLGHLCQLLLSHFSMISNSQEVVVAIILISTLSTFENGKLSSHPTYKLNQHTEITLQPTIISVEDSALSLMNHDHLALLDVVFATSLLTSCTAALRWRTACGCFLQFQYERLEMDRCWVEWVWDRRQVNFKIKMVHDIPQFTFHIVTMLHYITISGYHIVNVMCIWCMFCTALPGPMCITYICTSL